MNSKLPVRGMAVFAVVLVLAATGAAGAGSHWRTIRQVKIAHQTTIAGFLDTGFGITVGPYGAVYYTSDGGSTWKEADNNSACRFGLDIVDRNVALHGGNGGPGRSLDGGRTWKKITNGERYHFLSFIDADTGWVGTSDNLWSTVDSAVNLVDMALPDTAEAVTGICARSIDEGYLLDDQGQMYHTANRGGSWSRMKLNIGEQLLTGPVQTSAVRFTDAGIGTVAVYSFKRSAWVIARSENSGRTWRQENVQGETGTCFLSPDGTILTIFSNDDTITVWQYTE